MVLHLVRGDRLDQRELLRRLTELQYARGDYELRRGTYRVRGEVIDVFPAESETDAIRIELVRRRDREPRVFDPLTGEVLRKRAALHGLSGIALRDARGARCSTRSKTIKVELQGAPGTTIQGRTSWSRRSACSSARSSTSR